MKVSNFSRYAFCICVAVAILAGCGGSQSPIGAPGAMPQTAIERGSVLPSGIDTPLAGRQPMPNQTVDKLLYSFRRGFGGPAAGLTDVNGTLYGTTPNTVFAISTSGKERLLNSLDVDSEAALIDLNGTLYGTTESGGIGGWGTIFKITTSGKERVLHRFHSVPDGANPEAGLTDVNGTLYGTTSDGGSPDDCFRLGCGTIFKITRSGKFTVLHTFTGAPDGSLSRAQMINVNGILYGTTLAGGANNVGTVFEITTSGKESVLHSFGSPSDAGFPSAGLIDVKGTLYGTTKGNNGTVFKITKSGEERVLYNFQGSPDDGSEPQASLIDVHGTLYGSTSYGGSENLGTVFKITTSGKEHMLHSFFGYPVDGSYPVAGLIDVNGTLYGTTAGGGSRVRGCHHGGCGTVFTILP